MTAVWGALALLGVALVGVAAVGALAIGHTLERVRDIERACGLPGPEDDET